MANDVSKLRELVINSEVREQIMKAMNTVFEDWYTRTFKKLEDRAKKGFLFAEVGMFHEREQINRLLKNTVAYITDEDVINYFQFRLAQNGYHTEAKKRETDFYYVTVYWWDYKGLNSFELSQITYD